jgi:hypothetical protein
MPDEHQPLESAPLQFDRAVTASDPSISATMPRVACAGCRKAIDTEYFQVNGHVFCGRCRTLVEAAAETPRGIGPMMVGGLFGLGAGIAGAAIYYAVIAIAHLEIGIVAILIGYMVGYSVRKGAGGRGGVRFQILAATLTYASVALAYSPLAMSRMASPARAAQTTSARASAANVERITVERLTPARMLLSLGVLSAFIAALPVLFVVGSFPFGLISGFIIFIGMRQAWRMTAAAKLDILGPYRVGALVASAPA